MKLKLVTSTNAFEISCDDVLTLALNKKDRILDYRKRHLSNLFNREILNSISRYNLSLTPFQKAKNFILSFFLKNEIVILSQENVEEYCRLNKPEQYLSIVCYEHHIYDFCNRIIKDLIDYKEGDTYELYSYELYLLS